AGVHTFSALILKTAGSQTVTATDTVTGSITGTTTVSVSAAATTHYSETAPANSTAGGAFSVTITALDAFGNTATGYTGTAHFSSSDGQAVLPSNSTRRSCDAGVLHFSSGLTLKTAGSQTVTATDTVTGSITGNAT